MQGSHQEVSRQSSCLLPPQYGGEHIWNRACEAAREGVKATGQYFVLRFTNDKTEDQRREQRLSQGSRAKKHQSKKPGYSGCCGQTKACNLCHRLRGRENTQEGMERRTELNEECLPGALREAEDYGKPGAGDQWGPVSWTDLCTWWDSQQALRKAPGVTLRSASVVDQNSKFAACLHLLRD